MKTVFLFFNYIGEVSWVDSCFDLQKGLHDTRCSQIKNVVIPDSVEYTSYALSPEVSHLLFHFQILHLYCHSKFQSNYNLSALSDPSPLLPFQNSVEITIFQHNQTLHRYCHSKFLSELQSASTIRSFSATAIPNFSRNYNLPALSGLHGRCWSLRM